MNTMLIQSRSGPDRKIHLEVPVEQADAEFEVEIVVRPKAAPASAWPPGYFDLFGSITDDTFVRPPQGELPTVVELE